MGTSTDRSSLPDSCHCQSATAGGIQQPVHGTGGGSERPAAAGGGAGPSLGCDAAAGPPVATERVTARTGPRRWVRIVIAMRVSSPRHAHATRDAGRFVLSEVAEAERACKDARSFGDIRPPSSEGGGIVRKRASLVLGAALLVVGVFASISPAGAA